MALSSYYDDESEEGPPNRLTFSEVTLSSSVKQSTNAPSPFSMNMNME